MLKKSTLFALIMFLFLGAITPNIANAESSTVLADDILEIETPEEYTVDVYSDEVNDEGLFEVIGYKKVISNTLAVTEKNIGKMVVHAKEEYYDLNDNLIKSIILYEEVENDYNSGKMKVKSLDKELSKENGRASGNEISKQTRDLNKKEKSKKIKSIVENELSELSKLPFKEMDGITYDEVEQLQKSEDLGFSTMAFRKQQVHSIITITERIIILQLKYWVQQKIDI